MGNSLHFLEKIWPLLVTLWIKLEVNYISAMMFSSYRGELTIYWEGSDWHVEIQNIKLKMSTALNWIDVKEKSM